MIVFAWPTLLLLIPLPWLLGFIWPSSLKTEVVLKAPFVERAIRLQDLTTKQSIVRYRPFVFVIWLLLVVAAMRPQWLQSPQHLVTSGRDLILAVDISASMNFPDLDHVNNHSRLDLVKKYAGEFIEQRQGDRLGLVLFASEAYRQTPLTYDRQAVRQLLEEAEIGLAGRETAIGDAIASVVSQLVTSESDGKANIAAIDTTEVTRKILILISDGANNSGQLDPIKAAEMAANIGMQIYTLGLGAESMVARTAQGIGDINPSRDLDESLLKNIADITGGQYARIKNSDELKQLYQQLNQIEPSLFSHTGGRPTDELFFWPLALALLMSFVTAVRFVLKSGYQPNHNNVSRVAND